MTGKADYIVDSMLWELMKFCIPIGFILWLSIYLMYRNQLSKWSERVPGSASGGGAPAGPVVGGRPTVNGDSMDLDLGKAAKVAWQYVVRNIGSAVGARDGAVVASPSWGEWEDEPDYYVS